MIQREIVQRGGTSERRELRSTTRSGAALAGAALLALGPAALPAQPFEDVTKAAGITFEHRSAPEKKYILESMSGGVAVLDADLDGDLDLYFVNSLTVETAKKPKTAPSALYLNRGDGTFEDVAEKAGVAFPGWGVGVCTADLDGDDYPEIYVTGVGANKLYMNRGDGTFEEKAAALGAEVGGWSAGCGFADYDRDGDLDLFVTRYVEVDLDNLPVFGEGKTCQYRGIAVQCGPRGLPGTTDVLLRNDGGRFTDVSEKAGVHDPDEFFGLGVAWLDVDDDGWLDLYVANDSGPNYLYRNRGDGTFEELGFPLGVAVSEDGGEQGGMGVAVGDYRNDGRMAIFVTNFSEEYNTLYANQGDFFTDVSFRSATAPSSLRYVGWGTALLDVDNDGWLDLTVVNGHVYPQLDETKLAASAAYKQPKLYYRNKGDGTFVDESKAMGPAYGELRVGRGLAVGDLDGDGRLDLVVNDLDGAPQVLMNRTARPGSWLAVDLEGAGMNRDAIGAVVTVRIGETRRTRLVQSGASYLSQNDVVQHFGLGAAKTYDAVEVRWPDGSTSEHPGGAANRAVKITKPGPAGKGAEKSSPEADAAKPAG
ncbi:MAG: CRTAC1 family protein [Acidobacteriota bacterium]